MYKSLSPVSMLLYTNKCPELLLVCMSSLGIPYKTKLLIPLETVGGSINLFMSYCRNVFSDFFSIIRKIKNG